MVIFNLVNSRTGRAVMAARDNRIAAESVGISVTKYKMIAFVVSAALAGAAGTLYGCSQTTFAATKFDFNTSILILVFVVLDGPRPAARPGSELIREVIHYDDHFL